MIKHIFENTVLFAVLYFLIVFIDIYVEIYCSAFPYRFISRLTFTFILFGYYCFNKLKKNKKKDLVIYFALTTFLLGSFFLLNHNNIIFLSFSVFFFSIGKIFFCAKFSHNRDFNVSRLIPFSIIMFGYAVFLMSMLYEKLETFIIPALLTLFLTMLMLQFAYLRKGVFNNKSYLYVFFGIISFALSESLTGIKIFSSELELPFQELFIIMLYDISLYLIVFGTIKEEENKISL